MVKINWSVMPPPAISSDGDNSPRDPAISNRPAGGRANVAAKLLLYTEYGAHISTGLASGKSFLPRMVRKSARVGACRADGRPGISSRTALRRNWAAIAQHPPLRYRFCQKRWRQEPWAPTGAPCRQSSEPLASCSGPSKHQFPFIAIAALLDEKAGGSQRRHLHARAARARSARAESDVRATAGDRARLRIVLCSRGTRAIHPPNGWRWSNPTRRAFAPHTVRWRFLATPVAYSVDRPTSMGLRFTRAWLSLRLGF